MADRLIQIVVPAEKAEQVSELIEQASLVEVRHDTSSDIHLITVQVPADQVETLLDPIQARFDSTEGFHAFVLPVEAALPRGPEPDNTTGDGKVETARGKVRAPSRISREELYDDLSELARVTRVFVALVVLSTVVAAVGLARDNAAIVIGAMVIAPLLGPNMALSLATTLGDAQLAARSLRATAVSLVLAGTVALCCGFLLHIDPASSEIASRTFVGPTDVIVALAAGIAGSLAFTTGISASLIGVMVAVALLPPLVVCAMLLAAGHPSESLGALLLLLCNVISINLAGVGTFLAQGVSPRSWWDAERSKRMTRRALAVWISLLVVVTVLIVLSNISRSP